MPEVEAVILFQARRRVATLAQLHAALHGSCAAEPCPIPTCCVSQNIALARLALISVLLTANSLTLRSHSRER